METNNDILTEIKTKSFSLKNEDDLLCILNLAKQVVYGEKTRPITMRQLKYHAFASYNNPNRYVSFQIPKKRKGEFRTITAPNNGLKAIQRILNFIFQQVFEPHAAAMGFVPTKSIVDNARVHTGQNYVYNIDLKDFFPSIDQKRLFVRLQVKPFCFPKDIAGIIANLCCHKMEVERKGENGNYIKVECNVLPQGAPTSPTITNIICERMDRQLSGLARRFNLKYSRYADDITFSSMHNVYQQNGEFVAELHKIIAGQNFVINESKTRLQSRNRRQEVTGLIVNEHVNVFQRYVKDLRLWLHIWESNGYEQAQNNFIGMYKTSVGGNKKGSPHIENVLSGKLLYLQMVKGEKNSTFVKLNERFEKLTEQHSPISNILDIWEKEGMEKAMELYEKSINMAKSEDTVTYNNVIIQMETFEAQYNCQLSLFTSYEGRIRCRVSPSNRFNIPIYVSKRIKTASVKKGNLALKECYCSKGNFYLIEELGEALDFSDLLV